MWCCLMSKNIFEIIDIHLNFKKMSIFKVSTIPADVFNIVRC